MKFVTKHITVAVLMLSLLTSAGPAQAATAGDLQESIGQLSALIERMSSRLFGRVLGVQTGSVTLEEAIASQKSDVQAAAMMAHPGNENKITDHAYLLSLFPKASDSSTYVALNSGSWFSANTWSKGSVPGNGDNVYIPMGVSVTYDDKSNVRLDRVAVDGELHFSTSQNTEIFVDTLMSGPGATFTMGTPGNPVSGNVSARVVIHRDNGPVEIGDASDIEQLQKGIILHGVTKINGQDKTDHLKASIDPRQGDTSLTFASMPKNWKVGDKLVVTGTTFPMTNVFQDEVVTIKSITPIAGGARVELNQSLAYDHLTPANLGGHNFQVSVANFTRNVFFGTETSGNQYLSNGKTVPIMERGHFMVMHNKNATVENAEFFELGRTDKTKIKDDGATNQTGRYSLHFHRTGGQYGGVAALAEGNAVWGSPGWGVVQHDANANLISNAVFGVNGGGMISEAGNETGIWRDNIVIQTTGEFSTFNPVASGGDQSHPAWRFENLNDSFHQAIGYGFKSRTLEVFDNIAVSSNGAGYSFEPMGNGDGIADIEPNTRDIIALNGFSQFRGRKVGHLNKVPLRHFDNNEAYVGHVGFNTTANKQGQLEDVTSVVDNLVAWEVRVGVNGHYQNNYLFKEPILSGISGNTSRLRGVNPVGLTETAIGVHDFKFVKVVDGHFANFDEGIFSDTFAGQDEELAHVVLGNEYGSGINPIHNFDGHDFQFPHIDEGSDWRTRFDVGRLTASIDTAASRLVLNSTRDDLEIVVNKVDGIGSERLDFTRDIWGSSSDHDKYYTRNGKYYVLTDVPVGDRITGSVALAEVAIELAFITSRADIESRIDATYGGELPARFNSGGATDFTLVDLREFGVTGNQLNGSPTPIPEPEPEPSDTDSDNVVDTIDNCVFTPNPGQTDTDNDGIGDACEENAESSSVFAAGDEVETTDNLNVRDSADGNLLGTQIAGQTGVVESGGIKIGNYFWWLVDFAGTLDGWVAQNWLRKVTEPTPEPEPEPEPTPAPTPSSGNVLPITISGGTFNGDSSVIKLAPDNSQNVPAFSVKATISVLDTSPLQGLVTKDASGRGEGGHYSLFVEDGLVQVRFQNKSSSKFLTHPITANTEYDIVTTSDGSNVALYVNGVKVDSSSYNADWVKNDEYITVGALGSNSLPGTDETIADFYGVMTNIQIVAEVNEDGSVPEPEPIPEPEPEPIPEPDNTLPITISGGTFNGDSSVIKLAPDNSQNVGEYTVRLKFSVDDTDTKQGLVSKDASGRDGGGHFTMFVENNQLQVRFQNSSNSKFLRYPIQSGVKYEVMATSNGSEVTLAINGNEVARESYMSAWETNDEYIIIGGSGEASAPGTDAVESPLYGTLEDLSITEGIGTIAQPEPIPEPEPAPEPEPIPEPEPEPIPEPTTTGLIYDLPSPLTFEGKNGQGFEIPGSRDFNFKEATIIVSMDAEAISKGNGIFSKSVTGKIDGDMEFGVGGTTLIIPFRVNGKKYDVNLGGWNNVNPSTFVIRFDGETVSSEFLEFMTRNSSGHKKTLPYSWENNDAPIIIGETNDYGRAAIGTVSEVLIYNEVLTNSEILDLNLTAMKSTNSANSAVLGASTQSADNPTIRQALYDLFISLQSFFGK